MRILIAIHHPKHIDTILRFASEFTGKTGTALTMLIAMPSMKERRQFDHALRQASALLQPAKHKCIVRYGNPADEITRETHNGWYDLVILDGDQETHTAIRLMKNRAENTVANQAPCPVLIVKGKINEIHDILLCDSGGSESTVISEFTMRILNQLHSSQVITVLHVMSQISAWPGVRGWPLRADAEELIQEHAFEGGVLERDIKVLEKPGVQLIPKVRHGLVTEEVLAEAQEGDYDLVVIGAHRGDTWQRVLLEDIARQIVIQSDRPVLVVK